jgi:hypothetical protein
MNKILFSFSSTLHSHTHWQAPQADTQAKACQRVCLSHAEKKKLKIPFSSKNFKNANPQSDTKTFGQLVAKLNKDKGFSHGQQERQPVTAVWRNGGFSASYDSFVVGSSAVLRLNFCAKKPPLRQAAKRCAFKFSICIFISIIFSLILVLIPVIGSGMVKRFVCRCSFSRWQSGFQ